LVIPRRRDTVSSMRIDPPTMPLIVARAYGVDRARTVPPVDPVRRADQAAHAAAAARQPTKVDRLVGAVVPGGVHFTETAPRPRADTIAMYAAPSRTNPVATAPANASARPLRA